jgi:transposase
MTSAQVEVITSVERRRRWSQADKERLVVASLEPGAMVSAIARKAGIHPTQLYRWRQFCVPVRVARRDRDRVWLWCPPADHRSG